MVDVQEADVPVIGPNDLTPVELRNGIWYKREDLHRNRYGVNGAKYRACRHMLSRAVVEGYDYVVSAQSVLSPQSSICATLAEEMGIGCVVVYGATNPDSVIKHPNPRIAFEAGAMIDTTCRVAYNGVIQPYAAKLAKEIDAWQLPYAISMPEDSSPEDLEAFMAVGGEQVANLPKEVETLVLPFGSGNTTAGVLYGLSKHGSGGVERIVLVGVGPDRFSWLEERFSRIDVSLNDLPPIVHMPLHPWFAEYSDRMPETLDDIVLHPTYEGKVARFLNKAGIEWWEARDDKTCFWIVGGPIQ